jgi:hypothetical protein
MGKRSYLFKRKKCRVMQVYWKFALLKYRDLLAIIRPIHPGLLLGRADKLR